MVVFNLLTFPNVCRVCLQALHPDQMVSLETHHPLFEANVGTFLRSITHSIPDTIAAFLPSEVCFSCLEVMEFFFKYRRKMVHLHLFLEAIVGVKFGDKSQLTELFRSKAKDMELLIRDLDLCNKPNASVEDLLEEYEQYTIASMPLKEHSLIKEEMIGGPSEEDEDEEDTHVPTIFPSSDGYVSDSSELVSTTDTKNFVIKTEIAKVEKRQCQPNENFTNKVKNEGDQFEGFEEVITDDDSDDDQESECESAADGRQMHPSKHLRPKPTFKQLYCKLCSFNTKHTVAYELHCKKHEAIKGKAGYVCPNVFCLKLFSTKEALKEHRKNNRPHRYVCEICGTWLKHRRTFEVHLERHVGITHFQCSYCSDSFFTEPEVEAHLKAMHFSQAQEECELCGALFTSKKLLRQHHASHDTQRSHQCTECDASFKTRNHLTRHIQTVHQAVRFFCEHCSISYGRRDKLRLHMEVAHQIQAYFACQICVRLFETDEALQEHLSRHANPKELECGTCLTAYHSQSSYDKHICITYQDDYVCCERDFKNHLLYNKHMLSHGIKVNARVRPDQRMLVGQARTIRKSRKESSVKKGRKSSKSKRTESQEGCLHCGQLLPTNGSEEQHICKIYLDGTDLVGASEMDES